jgi:hypothetical protein
MDDYQGKRPKQVKDSEDIVFWAISCYIISLLVYLFLA